MDGVEGASQPDDLVFRIGLVIWCCYGLVMVVCAERRSRCNKKAMPEKKKETEKTSQDPNRKSPSSIFGAFLVGRVVRGVIPEVILAAFCSNELLKSNPKSRLKKTVKS